MQPEWIFFLYIEKDTKQNKAKKKSPTWGKKNWHVA